MARDDTKKTEKESDDKSSHSKGRMVSNGESDNPYESPKGEAQDVQAEAIAGEAAPRELFAKVLIERYLLIWLMLISGVAYFWPVWFPGVADPFLASKPPALYFVFAVTMFAIGSLLPRDEVVQVARRWPTVLGGTTIQYLSMPLLAYGIGRLFQLEGPAMIGIIMVGCVPGAMASNVLTMVARGNVSYSLSLTTSATLVSPIVVPFALWLALRQRVEFPTAAVSWRLCWMVVLPVVAGYCLSQLCRWWRRMAQLFGAIVANGTILWIIAVVVALNRARLLQLNARLFLALLAVNLLGYLAGFWGGLLLRLPQGMRRALTLEIGMQNAGLGTVLALGIFKDEPATALPAAIYTFGCMFTGTILARLWAEFGAKEGENNATTEVAIRQ